MKSIKATKKIIKRTKPAKPPLLFVAKTARHAPKKRLRPMDAVSARKAVSPQPRLYGQRISVRVVKESPRQTKLRLMTNHKQPGAFWAGIRKPFGRAFKAVALSLVLVLAVLPMFQGFEAHLVQVKAELVQIDPPVLTPPGQQIPWHNPIGGTNLTAPLDVVMSDIDPDATHIYFTYATGTNPTIFPDPVCGEPAGANGGGGLKATVELSPLNLNADSVVKAMACNGSATSSQKSLINIKIYTFIEACPAAGVDFPANLALLAAGTASGNDDILLGADVVVNGSVRSNDDINEDSGVGAGNDPDINGDATAGDNVDTDINVSGTTTENAPQTTLPDLGLPLWETRAKAGGTVNGSLIFANNTSGIELGPMHITGNVVFGNNNSAVIKGPLYIQGNLIINQNTVITQDASFGDDFAIIIVGGTIDIADDVAFQGSGTTGAVLLATKAGPVNGSNAAIDVSSDASDLGDVVLYALNGDIHIRDARIILAAFAKSGGNSPAIEIDTEGASVNYRTLPGQIACGQEYAASAALVINEFMPNPSGSDQGTAGGALDGEWVELYNGLAIPVDVNGWALYDNNNAHELIIATSTVNATSTVIQPGGHLAVYRDGDADFELDNSGGDAVRLFNAPVALAGVLVDSHSYTVNAPADKSFARVPDGTANWIDPEGTPGEPNLEFFSEDTTPTEPVVFADDTGTEYSGEILEEATAGEGGGNVKGVATENGGATAEPTEESGAAGTEDAATPNAGDRNSNSEPASKEEPAILPDQNSADPPPAPLEPPVSDPPPSPLPVE